MNPWGESWGVNTWAIDTWWTTLKRAVARQVATKIPRYLKVFRH